MRTSKEAARDAHESARARMSYGEGAGTRRKLINAAVEHKIITVPGYEKAYFTSLQQEDMVEHAQKARKERNRKDVSKKIDRNIRGLSTGNNKSLTTGVIVLTYAGVIAHRHGLDKKALDYTKARYSKAKYWVKVKTSDLRVVK